MGNQRAAIYTRISRDALDTGLGVQRQEEDARRLCESRGWDITRVYSDNDISAYSGRPRPAYNEMLAAMKAGMVDVVVCWHTDRLHRSPKELETYIEASHVHGVKTYAVQAGELDLATHSGQAIARTLGAWARYESGQKSDRIKRQKRQALETDLWRGGHRPFGWDVIDRTLVINTKEAAWLLDASQQILAGASLRSLAADLEAKHMPTPRGGKWTGMTVRQILLRPFNAGLRLDSDGQLVQQQLYPPIVSEDVWRAVTAVLNDKTRLVQRGKEPVWLLTGLAECWCGTKVKTKKVISRGRSYTSYACREEVAGHVTKHAQYADDHVNMVMPVVLARPELWRAANAEKADTNYAVEAAGLRARLDEAADSFADGNITQQQLSRITARLKAKLEELEGMMAETHAGVINAAGRTPEQVWAEAGLEQRRIILQATVTVTLTKSKPGSNKFDARTVVINPIR